MQHLFGPFPKSPDTKKAGYPDPLSVPTVAPDASPSPPKRNKSAYISVHYAARNSGSRQTVEPVAMLRRSVPPGGARSTAFCRRARARYETTLELP
ncbi:MAG: hypothetical protein AVDCRST_MAG25-3252 [uncultured Rubrobacteraceae bacterium]|uniref:Uncharacterized protein n=1 Tax=uncultured Rubrobacteraceae bacterium TaxID=349277 RepID=A0A6J4S4W6_9ACTN|nr:MAG: hypothetical protein AVDCRST_MAG25-3252 [uncultured Rubrobacteraceae bacterium]